MFSDMYRLLRDILLLDIQYFCLNVWAETNILKKMSVLMYKITHGNVLTCLEKLYIEL